MTDYRIPAIPTAYAGRQYRSRLEARWAAMFDRLGWQHEYEPYDLGKWSPDFLLRGFYGSTVLVEIKPITSFDQAVVVTEKMTAAVFERDLQDEISALLLLGVSPISHGDGVQIGWVGEPYSDAPDADWHPSALAWVSDHNHPMFRADFLVPRVPGEEFQGALTDEYWLRHDVERLPPLYPEHTMQLWAEATNAVQWKPPS